MANWSNIKPVEQLAHFHPLAVRPVGNKKHKNE